MDAAPQDQHATVASRLRGKKAPEALNRLLRAGLRSNFREEAWKRLSSHPPNSKCWSSEGFQAYSGYHYHKYPGNIPHPRGRVAKPITIRSLALFPFPQYNLNNPIFARAESEQLGVISHIYTKIVENKKRNKSQRCGLFPDPRPMDGTSFLRSVHPTRRLINLKPADLGQLPTPVLHKSVRQQEGTG